MPNSCLNCCGTCWFNSNNKGHPGSELLEKISNDPEYKMSATAPKKKKVIQSLLSDKNIKRVTESVTLFSYV